MNNSIIEASRLVKYFGRTAALNGLSLQLTPGSVLGLLGVNGAGKTTLIRLLTGQIWPDGGRLKVFGAEPSHLPEALRTQIAYVGQDMQMPPWITAAAACQLHARMYPHWNMKLAAELLEEFQLPARVRFSRLSRGQQQKIPVLLAICQNARLLILDEPMSALDVPARRAVLSRLLDLVADGERTILLSSHLLSDLERIADQVAVIDRGRLVIQAVLDDLKAAARKIRISAAVPRELAEEFFPVLRLERPAEHETVMTVLQFKQQSLDQLLDRASAPPADVYGLNLEDLFMEMIEGNALSRTGGAS